MKYKKFLVKMRLIERLGFFVFFHYYKSASITCDTMKRLNVNNFHWLLYELFYTWIGLIHKDKKILETLVYKQWN